MDTPQKRCIHLFLRGERKAQMEAQVGSASVPAVREKDVRKAKRRKRIVRRIILLLLILLVLAVLAYIGYNKLKAEYTVTYQEYSATIGTISNSLSFSGTLQTVNSKTYSPASAVTVRNLYVKIGDDVKAGDKLMRLSNGQTLTADFDGRVNQLPVAEGDEVSSGGTLLQLVDFSHMKVSIRVDEYDISDVQAGDACRVTTTATENTFDSVIDNINYVSSSSGSVAYYTAIAYVDVGEGVYPGMQVTVTVPQEEAADVVILKEDALSFSRTNQAFVYMADADGNMQEVYVKTGVSNGNYVEITEGLKSGDTVYVEVETEESSSVSLLASLFGGRSIMGGGTTNRTMPTGSGDFDFGSFSFGGGDSGGSGRPSMPSGMGGGRQ